MTDIHILTIGDKVNLSEVKENTLPDEYKEMYASKLIDIKNEKTIIITLPIFKNRVINLTSEGEYIVTFFVKSEIYRAKGRVIKKYNENKIMLAEIYLLSDLVHFQRRNYYRLPCLLDTFYRVITPMEELLSKRIKDNAGKDEEIIEMCKTSLSKLQYTNMLATITDLSGGGIRFHTGNRHETGEKLCFCFILASSSMQSYIEVNVNIIEAKRIGIKPENYEYRATFDEITNDIREKIIRYVFEVQRSKRRRDKGFD